MLQTMVGYSAVHRFADTHLPWDLDVTRDGGLRCLTRELGDLWLVDCQLGGMVGRREQAELRRTSGEFVAVLLVRYGVECFTQRGQRAQVPSGSMTLWDSTGSSECFSDSRLQKTTLFFPRDQFSRTLPSLDRVVARTVPASPTLRLLFSWLETVSSCDTMDERAALTAGRTALDLLTASLGGVPELTMDTADLRLMEIQAFIREHFTDPALTVDAIALGCHVSVRYIHTLFSRSPTSCRQYLMETRLTAARRQLSEHPWLSVTQVAHGCGFDSSSSFSRSYRRRFGHSPRDERSV